MRLLLISALPDVTGLVGLAHHHPAGEHPPGQGIHVVRVTRRSAADAAGAGLADAVAAEIAARSSSPGEGPAVAHLTGNSPAAGAVAGALTARSVPYVYSPMLGSLPSLASAPARLLRALSPAAAAAHDALALAGRVAARSAAVIHADRETGERLAKQPGFRGVRSFIVPAPRLEGFLPATERPFTNLVAAFCDSLSPEWNVLRLLQALTKINADALVVAGGSDDRSSDECERFAALNPRVKFVRFERRSGAQPGARSSGVTLEEARPEAMEVLRRASVVVDASARGLAGVIASAAAAEGIPVVVSRRSAAAHAGGAFTFDPSSWELLNHALNLAFNRLTRLTGTGSAPGGAGKGGPAGPGEGSPTTDARAANAEAALRLGAIYREIAGGA